MNQPGDAGLSSNNICENELFVKHAMENGGLPMQVAQHLFCTPVGGDRRTASADVLPLPVVPETMEEVTFIQALCAGTTAAKASSTFRFSFTPYSIRKACLQAPAGSQPRSTAGSGQAFFTSSSEVKTKAPVTAFGGLFPVGVAPSLLNRSPQPTLMAWGMAAPLQCQQN